MNEKIVLGIHIGHDRAAALLKDGYIIGSIAQERLDRIKHSRSVMIPYDAIDSIMAQLSRQKFDVFIMN